MKTDTMKTNEEYLDDITFIEDMRHSVTGPFHQYDFLLDAQRYGWAYMVATADYLAGADLENISEVRTGDYGSPGMDITASYHDHGDKFSDTPQLKVEQGFLSVAGVSKVLEAPAKVMWVNQTRAMRLYTLKDDELLVKKYIETLIRQTFGTKDAMKLGRSASAQEPGSDQQAEQFDVYKAEADLRTLIGRDPVPVKAVAEHILDIDRSSYEHIMSKYDGTATREYFVQTFAKEIADDLHELDTEVYVDVISELAVGLKGMAADDLAYSVVPYLIDDYELRMQDVLQEQAEILRRNAVKKEFRVAFLSVSGAWVDGFLGVVENWLRYADPLIKLAAARETENEYVNRSAECLKDLMKRAFLNSAFNNVDERLAKAFAGYFADIPSIMTWVRYYLSHVK